MHLSSVVLPHPDGPTTQTNSPLATVNETLRIACVALLPVPYVFADVADLQHPARATAESPPATRGAIRASVAREQESRLSR